MLAVDFVLFRSTIIIVLVNVAISIPFVILYCVVYCFIVLLLLELSGCFHLVAARKRDK